MRVAFLHAKQSPRYANWMVGAVREHMPGVEILHLTDAGTPAIEGCTVVRREWEHDNPMIFRMEHLAALEGEVLVLDTDVVVQRDLSPVFGLDFDMALTWRDGPIMDGKGVDITRAMPINCGVMFQRNSRFWRECLRWCVGKDPGWYADQLAVAQTIWRFDVLRLHCENFNHKPRSADEDVSGRWAVHYKGNARRLMDARFARKDE